MLSGKKYLTALLLLAFGQGAIGQVKWTVTHPDTDGDGRYIYTFQCLSCYGNNSTVAGILRDTTGTAKFIPNQHHVFWNSADGGLTWTMQDPGLPVEWDVQNDPWQRVQRIDSLNIVAIGAAGLIMRSFDAGNTWVHQSCQSKQGLTGVHFSDSLTGILTAYPDAKVTSVFTTTDGGRNWRSVPFSPVGYSWNYSAATFLWQCHSYGNGKFRVFENAIGPVYSTTDNWKTITTTKLVVDSTKDPSWNEYYFKDCTFSDSSDDILIYGVADRAYIGAVMRSDDAGNTWTDLFTPAEPRGLYYSTQIDGDTILAAGFSTNNIIQSTDRGRTWKLDSIPSDIVFTRCSGLQWVKGSAAVGIFSGLATHDFLLRREVVHSSVRENQLTSNNGIFIYPNPATTEINITTQDISKPLHLVDILGREVMRGMIAGQGKITFDVSNIPRGIYDLLLEDRGRMIPVGKVAVLGK